MYIRWHLLPHYCVTFLYSILVITRIPAIYEKRFGAEFTGVCVHPFLFEKTETDMERRLQFNFF
jgi:hypothetical protein